MASGTCGIPGGRDIKLHWTLVSGTVSQKLDMAEPDLRLRRNEGDIHMFFRIGWS